MIGVNRSTVAAIENRKRMLTWETFLALLLVFIKNPSTDKLLNAMEIYTDEFNAFIKGGFAMIHWLYFPKNRKLDDVSRQIVAAFEAIASDIDSESHTYTSDDILAIVRPGPEACGFAVEKSKRKEDLVAVPVLFGQNGRVEKSFEADVYLESAQYVIEVEAGRAVVNYQFLKDFFEACTRMI